MPNRYTCLYPGACNCGREEGAYCKHWGDGAGLDSRGYTPTKVLEFAKAQRNVEALLTSQSLVEVSEVPPDPYPESPWPLPSRPSKPFLMRVISKLGYSTRYSMYLRLISMPIRMKSIENTLRLTLSEDIKRGKRK